MTDSRVKGHKFENDVCKLIGLEFSISVRRNLEQTREGGGDIMLNPFLIECKRYAQQGSNWFKDDWWEQVKRASQNEFIPILVYKYDRQPIRVVLPLVAVNPDFEPDNFGFSFCENALRPVVTDWDTAAMVMREWLCDE